MSIIIPELCPSGGLISQPRLITVDVRAKQQLKPRLLKKWVYLFVLSQQLCFGGEMVLAHNALARTESLESGSARLIGGVMKEANVGFNGVENAMYVSRIITDIGRVVDRT